MLEAANRSFEEGLIFLLPCSLIYQEIGEYIQTLPGSISGIPEENNAAIKRYKKWVEKYSSLERRQRVEKFIEIINDMVSVISSERIDPLKAAFYKASQYEFELWDSTYHLRQ